MSRSNYTDHNESNYLYLYRTIVDRAIKGKRGQEFLKRLAKTLDQMPVKRLIAEELIAENGEVCAIGAVCKADGINIDGIDICDPESVGKLVGISTSMAAEIEYINDELGHHNQTPEMRWIRMRDWVTEKLLEPK